MMFHHDRMRIERLSCTVFMTVHLGVLRSLFLMMAPWTMHRLCALTEMVVYILCGRTQKRNLAQMSRSMKCQPTWSYTILIGMVKHFQEQWPLQVIRTMKPIAVWLPMATI